MTYQRNDKEQKLTIREKFERNKDTIKKVALGVGLGVLATTTIALKSLREDVDNHERHILRMNGNLEMLRLAHNDSVDSEDLKIRIKGD